MTKWTYLTRAIPNVGDLLLPLEDVMRWKFLTSLTGQNPFNDINGKLMALPVRLGGLGITNPCADTRLHHDASLKITAPLTTLIITHKNQKPPDRIIHLSNPLSVTKTELAYDGIFCSAFTHNSLYQPFV